MPDIKLWINVFVEAYILISGFPPFLEVKVVGRVLMQMFASSLQIISGLDSQSKFQMFTLISGRHVVPWAVWGTPTWRLHTGLCKFVQNTSTNIWSLGKRTDLKLGEVFNLFIPYNIIIFLPFTHSMVFELFFNCVTVQAKNISRLVNPMHSKFQRRYAWTVML